MLRLAGVTKRYGPRAVLRDVTLEATAGETLALLGPNGCGKSTLLGVAATLLRPDEGTVAIAGLDAATHPERARAHLGVLLQDAPVDEAFTPREHLAWWSRVRRRPMDADALLREAGLAPVAHQPARTLSRGQRQRLALLLALAHDPEVALLDEPFTGLDDEGSRWLEALLAQRRGRRCTVLALHDLAHARLCDREVRLPTPATRKGSP